MCLQILPPFIIFEFSVQPSFPLVDEADVSCVLMCDVCSTVMVCSICHCVIQTLDRRKRCSLSIGMAMGMYCLQKVQHRPMKNRSYINRSETYFRNNEAVEFLTFA